MSGRRRDEDCQGAAWCDLGRDHSEAEHMRFLGDVAGIETRSGGSAILQVAVSGVTPKDRHVEVIASNGKTVQMILTWPQVAWLTRMLSNARQYA